MIYTILLTYMCYAMVIILTFSWIDDIETRSVNGSVPACPSCRVHSGIKLCNDNTIDQVLLGVKDMSIQYPTYQLVVTGHSLGAATATLAAVSLKLAGFDPMLYALGSPRVGNAAFSAYVAGLFPDARTPQRLTHCRDVVPHVPYTDMGYTHIDQEVYEECSASKDKGTDAAVVVDGCEPGGEDRTCSQQWPIYETTVASHLFYLDRVMACDTLDEAELAGE